MGRPRETRGDSDLMRRGLSRSRGRKGAASLVAAVAVFGAILSTQAGRHEQPFRRYRSPTRKERTIRRRHRR
jgi:hypothetical protein